MPVHFIEVKSTIADARADIVKKHLEHIGFDGKIRTVEITDVYTFDRSFGREELRKIGTMLVNPVIESASINTLRTPKHFDFAVEIGWLPGVTDNVAKTVKEGIEDLFKISFYESEGVYSSKILFLSGKLTKKNAEEIASALANPLIHRIYVKSPHDLEHSNMIGLEVPKVRLAKNTEVDEIDLNIPDEELAKLGKEGIKNKDGSRRGPLALNLRQIKAIKKYFDDAGRNPTDIELESLAQTWSEHCKHTIFSSKIDEIENGLYRHYIKRATQEIRKKNDFCVSVFTDNSGGIDFDDDHIITHKVETHNTPSALDPFGGAITGIVGVNRDALGFGLGAKPIMNCYGYCFADPFDVEPIYKGANRTQRMLSPRRILEGVVAGVNEGGNCSGIPTPLGFITFDDRYKGKPLVFVGTVGLIPKKSAGRLSHRKKAMPGDYIVMIGGRVGKDGIHGATFSSEIMDAGSPVTAVQIGDPITQKKFSDAIAKEARDLGLYNSITDNGAGGLSCSVAEMARESGGCHVDIEKIPTKYPNLPPWEIWISESQERMTLSVPKNSWKQFSLLMRRRDVEATVIGEFTDSGKCVIDFHGKTVFDLDLNFLHEGYPKETFETAYGKTINREPQFPEPVNQTKALQDMLSRLNIAGYEFISNQYDQQVQGNSVLKPLQGRGRGNASAAVIKPLFDSTRGIVTSFGINPRYSDIDTYHMAACAIDTSIRNAVAAGANPNRLAILDNFCWCSGNEPKRLGQLKESARACYEMATTYGTPFISGKDSMFNDFKGFNSKGAPIKISIPPTLLVSSIGIMEDVRKSVSLDAKIPGDLIYILGETFDELGASEYFAYRESDVRKKTHKTKHHNAIGNNVPKVRAGKNLMLYRAFHQAVQKELIASALSPGLGGLGTALAKTAVAGQLGINVSLENLPGNSKRNDFALYSESQGRFIVTIDPDNKKPFEKIMKNIPFANIGAVTSDKTFIIRGLNKKIILKTDIKSLTKAYRKTFRSF